MRIIIFCVLMGLSSAAHAQVAAVVEVTSKKIKVYERGDGGKVIKELAGDAIQVPAAQLSNASKYGLIQVDLRDKSAPDVPIVGWILKRSVKVDTRRALDVNSNCGKSLGTGSSVARGTKGLGGC